MIAATAVGDNSLDLHAVDREAIVAKKRKNKQSDEETAVPRRLGKGTWKLLDAGSTLAAAAMAPRVSNAVWKSVTGKKPPTSPQHPEVSLVEAITWAAIGGAVVQIVRTVVRRSMATYWVRSTGELPPGMSHLNDPN